MKTDLKKLLKKCIAQNAEYVLLHPGFIDNCGLEEIEKESLLKLAEELKSSNLVIIFDDIALTPYVTSYNGGYTLAGIKFNNIEKWK